MAAHVNAAPVIIKRKKVIGGDGHHGGAWKVAGIDFFTSMTCLFMVLWILAQNIEVEESIVHYFLDPFSAEIQRNCSGC